MTHEAPMLTPEQHAEQLIQRYERTLQEAVRVGYPEQALANPLEVFPEPTSPRDAAPAPEWDAAQQQNMRNLIAEFGFGRTADRSFAEAGLPPRAHVIYEAGQPHKLKAELEAVVSDPAAEQLSHTFAGSPDYRIQNPAEQASAQRQCGFVPETQYDLARAIATQAEGFVPLPEGDQVLAQSYDIHNAHAVGQEQTGQFTLIGHIKGREVVLMRIDREDFINDEGKPKYRKQPSVGDIVAIRSEILAQRGDENEALAFATSTTYQASRELEVVRAGLKTDRPTGVTAYGSARLAAVRGEAQPAPVPINQLPGELHAAAQSVVLLRVELGLQ